MSFAKRHLRYSTCFNAGFSGSPNGRASHAIVGGSNRVHKAGDSLHALVREHLELDAFAGHLFVFASRRKDRVKILYWDRDGFALWSKRLEEGTYAMPLTAEAGERRREITTQELAALLSGIDLQQAAHRKRYQR